MGSSYSGNHIAEDHRHTNITACNIEEPQQKYCPLCQKACQLEHNLLHHLKAVVRQRNVDVKSVAIISGQLILA